jgi:hypothetical protein
MLYVVTHDSRTDAERSSALAYIQSVARSVWSFSDGACFIEAAESGVDIRRGLSHVLEPGARIVVAMLAGFAPWQGFDKESEIWLARHL